VVGLNALRKPIPRYVCDLARYYRRSPELISYEEVRDWLYHLIKERKQSASSVNIAVNAVRFLYGVTLGRDTVELMASVPHTKCATRRAEVYARSEVEAILTAPKQPRERVFLMTVVPAISIDNDNYGALEDRFKSNLSLG
jgi:integrase/recombinase XerD